LLMEVQAASMQHFHRSMPREKTWNVMISRVGQKLLHLGERRGEKEIYSMTGEIISSMHVAIQKWKSIFDQREDRDGEGVLRQEHGVFPPINLSSTNTTTSEPTIDLDAFWEQNPLDTFFDDLFKNGQMF
jgi:hypothetical protein